MHNLDAKLDQASKYNYAGIEVFYEDLEYLARSYTSSKDTNVTPEPQYLIQAATEIRSMCDSRNLEVICLQPFMHYEGLVSAELHASRIEKLKVWFKLAAILETDIIQIPSNFLPPSEGETTGDRAKIVEDLKEVAVLGLEHAPQIRFAYEALCWGTYVDTWEASWGIVKAVDSPNFGLCLDTFNIAGRCWADPSVASGCVPNADALLKASLEKMVREVDVSKIAFVQVVDAERLRTPLTPNHVFHVDGQAPRMSWSRNCRLFPFEKAGYLPIIDVLKAICDGLGYQGWISFELFSRTMADPDASVPKDHARRGMESWEKLVKVMGWEGQVKENSMGFASAAAKQSKVEPSVCVVEKIMPVAHEQIAA